MLAAIAVADTSSIHLRHQMHHAGYNKKNIGLKIEMSLYINYQYYMERRQSKRPSATSAV